LPAKGTIHATASYQRRRLRLGILGVGSGVVLSLALIIFAFSGLARSLGDGTMTAVLMAGCAGLVMALLQLGFDAAGLKLDATHRLHSRAGASVIREQIVEAARWLAGFVAAATVAAWSITMFPSTWPGVLIALAGFGVSLRWILPGRPSGKVLAVDGEWMREVSSRLAAAGLPVRSLQVIDTAETTLAGGPVRSGMIWVSRAVAESSPALASSLIAREMAHARMYHRAQSAALSFVSLSVGVLASFGLVRAAGTPVADHIGAVVLILIASMTLLSFASLFVFPALGRRQVLAVDRFIADRFGLAEANAMLDALAVANLANDTLARGTAYVFHPIPPMAVRRAAVDPGGGQ
jgi:STE24 endopeptidase